MAEPDASRLQALERRIDRLTTALVIQSVLLALFVMWQALQWAPFFVLFVMIGLTLLVVYRRNWPQWWQIARRFVQRINGVSTTRSTPPGAGQPETDSP